MGLITQDGAVTLVSLGVMALIIAYMLMRYHAYYRRRGRDAESSRATPKLDPRPREYDPNKPDDVGRWEVHMHETARELAAMLDSKMAALQQLIREADRASERLKAILSAGAKSAGEDPPPSIDPRTILGHGKPAGQSTAGMSFDPFLSQPSSELAEPSGRQPMEERFEQICELADQGKSAADIAQKVGVPVGEVQLILGLRGRR